MKTSILILLVALCGSSYAQTAFEKTFPLAGAKELIATLDDPNVVIQTWDKNEILVKGTVSINNGENDSAFELQSSNTNGILSIMSVIKDKENLPRHIVIRKGDKDYIFKAKGFDDPEVKKFLDENGRDYSYMSNGIQIDISLQIFVPKNFRTTIDAKHGLVEFKSFDGPLKIVAKHGKVDATIPLSIGSLTARTKYGEILSNLDIKFDQQPFDKTQRGGGDKWTEVTAQPGKGPEYFIEAKHGTVYLRKP
jgi:hypothetical protein